MGNLDMSGLSLEDPDLYKKRESRGVDVSKLIEIQDACTKHAHNQHLTLLATSTGGLLNDEVRRLACMLKAERCSRRGS